MKTKRKGAIRNYSSSFDGIALKIKIKIDKTNTFAQYITVIIYKTGFYLSSFFLDFRKKNLGGIN
jgi:hypothetical protein